MSMVRRRPRKPYNWAHGFKPLTPKAALSKAHGHRKYAAKLLGHRSTSAVSRVANRSRSRRRR